jgi:PTH1 family peptidyl-tRNA hydrolase
MITTVIGLGNPGAAYARTRHNVGFMVVDALAAAYRASWRTKKRFEEATISLGGRSILLIKPTTFMNNSGDIVPDLAQRGIKPDMVLVVHDELELPFGKFVVRETGSAKGHNGIKSFIARWGEQFKRVRIGIDRPAQREEVPNYVLAPFTETAAEIDTCIEGSVRMIEDIIRAHE